MSSQNMYQLSQYGSDFSDPHQNNQIYNNLDYGKEEDCEGRDGALEWGQQNLKMSL